jgi:hypothetical protein
VSARGPQPHPVAVQRGTEQVGNRVFHVIDPIPPLPELQEGLLHEVGGFLSVADDDVQRLEQTPMFVLEERSEVRLGVLRPLRDPHDLAFCLHHPFTMPRGRTAFRAWAK